MWALRPSYYDNDMPIDLRKKVVRQRSLEEEKESRQAENVYIPKEIPVNVYRERWQPPPLLPVTNLYPFMSERYGVRCSLVNSEEKTHESRPSNRGTLESAIRKLHVNSKLKQTAGSSREERCRSTEAVLENQEETTAADQKPIRSNSCPDLSIPGPNSPQSQNSPGYAYGGTVGPKSNSSHYDFQPEHEDRVSSPPLGGAKKRKSFIPAYGDQAPTPRKWPKSPTEHPPYEEYFSHPEVLLRRQLQQQSTSPYLLHVYDYYQQLVQRLRDHSSSNAHLHPPVSPTPADDDLAPDAQRKRPCRALTGKHVKQGTGASLSTLLTLRQKIQERQRAREHHIVNGTNSKNMSSKKNKPQKSRQNTKNNLSKIQNC